MSKLLGTYARLDVDLVKGNGVYAYDKNNKKYIDFCGGIAVNCLGHAHPELVKALTEQAGKIWHTSNIFASQEAEQLADTLCKNSFAEKVFFCNSGAEAMEGVIKTIRRFQSDSGATDKNRIIVCTGGFHGRTIATISATGKGTEGFAPLLDGFDMADFNDLESVKNAITDKTAGIILEPVQGEGGVIPATTEFLTGVRNLCDEHNILLGFDEVQSGIGRTGYLFAHQEYGVQPDIMAIAKGLGGGFPIGAFLTSEKIGSVMVPGTHGSTFGGNPLAVAVATKVLEIVSDKSFLDNVLATGDYLESQLAQFNNVFSLRRKGLFCGLIFGEEIPNEKVYKTFTKHGLLCIRGGENSIRFLPPLNTTTAEIDEAVEIIKSCIDELV
ncbi:MAG: aspartate aminotransferase family protein [Alphaproteobacteria bacterium]